MTGVAAIAVATLGAVVLAARLVDAEFIDTGVLGLAELKANTAFCFLLVGAATWLLRRPEEGRRKAFGLLLAAVVAAIAGFSLAQYVLGTDLGVDELLVEGPAAPVGSSNPGGMAPNTALSFLLVTGALSLLDVRFGLRGWLSAGLALGAGMLALLALIGYVAGVPTLYEVSVPSLQEGSDPSQMAVPTALGFLLIAAAIACARPDVGPMQLLLSDTVGGRVMRLLVVTNAAVFITVGLVQALTPAAVSVPIQISELAVLAAAACALLGLNLMLLRRAFAPLERLAGAMGRIDLQRPGQEIPVYGVGADVVQLTEAFNAMLKRLERERRESARKILSAQEDERARVARELHDEVGQGLTAALLHLKRASPTTNGELEPELEHAKEAVRESLEEVRQITLRLRPEALDDLGLRSALLALCERIEASAQITVVAELPAPLPALDAEQELVAYRIAQEALTNVARHANADRAWLTVTHTDEAMLLTVEDDGSGIAADAVPGAGLEGMRERALLVAGTLKIGPSTRGGTAVNLMLPLGGER